MKKMIRSMLLLLLAVLITAEPAAAAGWGLLPARAGLSVNVVCENCALYTPEGQSPVFTGQGYMVRPGEELILRFEPEGTVPPGQYFTRTYLFTDTATGAPFQVELSYIGSSSDLGFVMPDGHAGITISAQMAVRQQLTINLTQYDTGEVPIEAIGLAMEYYVAHGAADVNPMDVDLNEDGQKDLRMQINETYATVFRLPGADQVKKAVTITYDPPEYYYLCKYRTLTFDVVRPEDTSAVGKTVVINGLRYIITSPSTASFIGLKKKNSKSSVIIPDVIAPGGKQYRVTAIASRALYRDKKVKTLSIGRNVTAIGTQALLKCAALKTVKGGTGVTVIGNQAFRSCVRLSSFPVMKQLQKIGSVAFYNCKRLIKFTLDTKVSSIGSQAFRGCSQLRMITVNTLKLTKKSVGVNAFQFIYGKATFKIKPAKLKLYKSIFRTKGGAPKNCRYK